jgi:NAD(P)-dependent dehydrogenase (short-subunit alcohol dehydrogenase family)
MERAGRAQGKVVLLTGGARGMGASHAESSKPVRGAERCITVRREDVESPAARRIDGEPMTWKTPLKSAATAALIAMAVPAPAAHADPDAIGVIAYLTTLSTYHVPYDSPGRMIDVGNDVCAAARGGTDFDAIGSTVASNGLTSYQAGVVMGAAVASFCPDMQPAIDRWNTR